MPSRSNSLREVQSEAGEAREACWFISSNSRFLLVYLFLGDETRCFIVAQKIELLGVERSPMRQIKPQMRGKGHKFTCTSGGSEACSNQLSMIKTYIWTPRSIFYYARELSYTLKWPWTMLLKLFLLLVYIEEFWNLSQSAQHGQKHISGYQDQPSTRGGKNYFLTPHMVLSERAYSQKKHHKMHHTRSV